MITDDKIYDNGRRYTQGKMLSPSHNALKKGNVKETEK